METWIGNIGAGLSVLVIGLMARLAREAWVGRRGRLAGWWLWVTYDPSDLRKRLSIWSIEVCLMRHRPARGASQVTGTVWRIYDRDEEPHYRRRWRFEGAYDDGVVEGRYAWTRDEVGSHGVLHVWESHPMVFEGKYIRVIKRGSPGALTHEREEAWTEWARLPDTLGGSLRAAVDAIPRRAAVRWYPWRLRRRLAIAGGPLDRWALPLAAAGVLVDNRPLLEEVRAERADAAETPREPLTLFRSQLGIFPQPRLTAPSEDDLPLAG